MDHLTALVEVGSLEMALFVKVCIGENLRKCGYRIPEMFPVK